jgi:GAF domain-containing protein
MTALAAQATIALENARLYGAATARGKRLATAAAHGDADGDAEPRGRLEPRRAPAVELFGSSVVEPG